MNMKIVIRAGGVGARLWPVSREASPKQFHAFTSSKTMLTEAIERVSGLAQPEDVYISTHQQCVALVQQQCPQVAADHLIIEPERKDTAAAIGLESITIRKHDPSAIVASLGSDHRVRNTEAFQQALRTAAAFVEQHPDYLVPIGIPPTQPDAGYGYIQLGKEMTTINDTPIWQVQRFTEKPSVAQAKEFLAQGNYLWNANMFVWRVDTLLALYERFLPEMYAGLCEIEAALGTPQAEATVERIYPQLQKIAVDYAIIERTDKLAALAADIGWNDIGDWSRLKDELAIGEADNVAIGAELLDMETKNTLVYSNAARAKKLVATLGVQNLVIVETDDVLLICDKYHSADVKEMVEKLKEQGRDDVL